MSGAPLLEVEHLTVEFAFDGEWAPVVHDVGFSLARGETLSIVGESGSGKTTAALALLGLLAEGGRVAPGAHVRLDGTDLIGLSERELAAIRGRDVGYIFQEPRQSLNPAYTVGEQIAEVVRRHRGVSRAEAWGRAVEMLDLVEIRDPDKRARDHPHRFSGGMCQRVMLAIALACEPRLLVADEPTTALDVTVQAQMLDLIREFQTRLGLAVLFITHDLGVVAETSDRTLVMYAGRAVEQGTTESIFHRPRHPYTAGLLSSVATLRHRTDRFDFIPGSVPAPGDAVAGCRFHPRCVHAVPGTCDVESIGPIPSDHVIDGATTQCLRSAALELRGIERATTTVVRGGPGAATAAGPERRGTVLDVVDLQKRFATSRGLLGGRGDHIDAARKVSFSVAKGTTLALVGESGAGKSTVGRLVLRLVDADAGSVRLLDEDVLALPQRRLRRLRSRATMIFQDPYTSFDPKIALGVAVAEPLVVHTSLGASQRQQRVLGLLDRVGLGPSYADRYPHELSGGELQRAAIARALTTDPELLVCDEPVAALDVSVRAQVLNLLRDLQHELGLAYVFISHDLSLVRLLATDVAVMRDGEIIEYAPVEQLFNAPAQAYTKALLDAVPVPDPASRRQRTPLLAVADDVSLGGPSSRT